MFTTSEGLKLILDTTVGHWKRRNMFSCLTHKAKELAFFVVVVAFLSILYTFLLTGNAAKQQYSKWIA